MDDDSTAEHDDNGPIDPRVAEIDRALNHRPAHSGNRWAAEMAAHGLACLERLAPTGLAYRSPPQGANATDRWRDVEGRLRALRADILAGRLPIAVPTPLRSSISSTLSVVQLSGWTETFAKHFPQDGPDESADYPEPDWFYWMNRRYWPTWTVVPALLLKQDPRSAMRAPYMNARWCAANQATEGARVMKAVITAILEDDIGSREADGPFTSNRVQPLDAVTWALGLLGIEPPPELVDAAIRKRRKLAAAEALLASGRDPAQGSSPQDDEPVPLPPKLTPENRSSFAALVAFRYARIPVSGAPGVAQLGELGVKAPLPRYIAPSGHYSIGFDELAEWADAVPGRWARVLDALRLWTGPGGAAAAD